MKFDVLYEVVSDQSNMDILDKSYSYKGDLDYLKLKALIKGDPTWLFHGTTRDFKNFKQNKNRSVLNRQYQGDGIFLTPNYNTAQNYIDANRNQYYSQDLIKELKKKNKVAGQHLENLVKLGFDKGWKKTYKDLGYDEDKATPELWQEFEAKFGGVDMNDLNDIAETVEGAVQDTRADDFDLFGKGSAGVNQDYDYYNNMLKKMGIKDNLLTPQVMASKISVKNPVVTDNRALARKYSKSKKYDAVIFTGDDLVDGVPEINLVNDNVKVDKKMKR